MPSNKSARKEKTCPGCGEIKLIGEFVSVKGLVNPRGKYCRDCNAEQAYEHLKELMEGRDFCLYCGTKFTRAYEYTSEDQPPKGFLHEDHMDALSLGGEDSPENTV